MLLQFRKLPTFDSESLVISEMPMQDVHLDRCHPVKIAFDDLHGLPVPCYVNQQASPAKAGPILDGNAR